MQEPSGQAKDRKSFFGGTFPNTNNSRKKCLKLGLFQDIEKDKILRERTFLGVGKRLSEGQIFSYLD